MSPTALILVVISAAIALATPLLYAALGEVVSESAGVINIQLEGMMLCGELAGVWAAMASGSAAIGFLGAAAAGLALAAVQGLLCFVLDANQVVSGVVLNILALGGTGFLAGSVLFRGGSAAAPTLDVVRIPLLADIPVVGPALFEHNVMVYAAYLLVPVLVLVRRHTTTGMALSAVGERPGGSGVIGRVGPGRVGPGRALVRPGSVRCASGDRWRSAGPGRAGPVHAQRHGRTGVHRAGSRGLCRWRPVGTLGAVLLVALTEALQVRAQVLGIDLPYQLLIALPYLVTVLASAGFLRTMRAPAALGSAYVRG